MCKCGSEEVVYVFSDMKIKRYMSVCGECGTYIKWVSDIEWDEIKNTDIKIITSTERTDLRRKP